MNVLLRKFVFILLELFQVNRLFRIWNAGKIRVLLYHNIAEDRTHFKNAISRDAFEHQLRYLSRYCNVVGLTADGKWAGLSDSKLNVLLTFDDGFENNFTEALPLLEKYRFKACFFIIGSCVATGSPPVFTNGTAVYQTMKKEALQKLAAAGMSLGSHSQTHRDFRLLNDAEVEAEAVTSQQTVQSITGNTSRLFAFPWGHHKIEQVDLLKRYYSKIFLVSHGLNRRDDVVLSRNEVDSSVQMFAATSGSLDFFAPRRSLRDRVK
mgnify:CR=1 FL=1